MCRDLYKILNSLNFIYLFILKTKYIGNLCAHSEKLKKEILSRKCVSHIQTKIFKICIIFKNMPFNRYLLNISI